MRGGRTLVLGLGNDLVGDDGAGPAVVRALRGRIDGREADLVESAASGMALLDLLVGYERAIVIDAIRTGRRPPGSIRQLGPEDLGAVLAPSPHYAGFPEMVAVAERLGLAFPRRLRVLAIEAQDASTIGAPLGAAVEAAVPRAARRVEELLRESW